MSQWIKQLTVGLTKYNSILTYMLLYAAINQIRAKQVEILSSNYISTENAILSRMFCKGYKDALCLPYLMYYIANTYRQIQWKL